MHRIWKNYLLYAGLLGGAVALAGKAPTNIVWAVSPIANVGLRAKLVTEFNSTQSRYSCDVGLAAY